MSKKVISIHAPRVGSDRIFWNSETRFTRFQSTLPVWGATQYPGGDLGRHPISIHAPRVGSDHKCDNPRCINPISIHAPRVGSDQKTLPGHCLSALFQSTLPVWGATTVHCPWCPPFRISIHAPRVGSDSLGFLLVQPLQHFNPRSPCGERLAIIRSCGR